MSQNVHFHSLSTLCLCYPIVYISINGHLMYIDRRIISFRYELSPMMRLAAFMNRVDTLIHVVTDSKTTGKHILLYDYRYILIRCRKCA